MALFEASLSVRIGIRRWTLFWRDKWVDGRSISEITPSLHVVVSKHIRNSHTVKEWLSNCIGFETSLVGFPLLFMQIWIISHLELLVERTALLDTPDALLWKWTSDAQYLTLSPYVSFLWGKRQSSAQSNFESFCVQYGF